MSELIQFTRRHKYDRDEGFADSPMSADVPERMTEIAEWIVADLSKAAGVSEEVAESAFVCWTMTQFLEAHESGKLERMTFREFLREKFGDDDEEWR